MAFCGLKCVNPNSEIVKILGIHFLCNENHEQDKNFFEHTVKVENILKHFKTFLIF